MVKITIAGIGGLIDNDCEKKRGEEDTCFTTLDSILSINKIRAKFKDAVFVTCIPKEKAKDIPSRYRGSKTSIKAGPRKGVP